MDYRISVEDTSSVDRNINIEIPRAILNERFNKMLSRTAQQVTLKGFRPGRAPKAMVQKLYGERIQVDVLNEIISAAFEKAVSENDLKIVGYPNIDVDDKDLEGDVKVIAQVSVFPEPEITEFDGISFEAETEQVDDETLKERLKSMQEMFAEQSAVEGREVAESGDIAKFDYEASIEGVKQDNLTGTDAEVELGSGRSLKDLELGMVGMKLGETREIIAQLPDEMEGDSGGKEALFTVTLKGLSTRVLPELTDEIAKKTGLAEDLAGLKAHVRESVEKSVATNNDNEKENKLFQALIEKNPFEVPQALVDREIRFILMEMRMLDPGKEESFRVDVTRFRDALTEPGTFRVKRAIILSKLVEKLGTSAGEAEVSAWLDELATKDGKTREEVNKFYGYPKRMEQLQEMVSNKLTVDKLLSGARIKEVPKKAE